MEENIEKEKSSTNKKPDELSNKPQQSTNYCLIFGIVAVVIVVVILIGYFGLAWILRVANKGLDQKYATTTPTAITPSQTIGELNKALDDSNSIYYWNEKYHYSLRYPTYFASDNITSNSDMVELYSASDKSLEKGIEISITNIDNPDNYYDVREYLKNMPVGDPEGAKAKTSTEYLNINGSEVAQMIDSNYHLTNYIWICGGKLINLSIQGLQNEENNHLIDRIIESLTPCAG